MTVKGALQAVQKPQASSGTHSGGSVAKTVGIGQPAAAAVRGAAVRADGLGRGSEAGGVQEPPVLARLLTG